MKKTVKFILTAFVICLLVSMSAFAQKTSGACGDNMTWKYDAESKVLTLDGTGDMWNYPVKYVESLIGDGPNSEWIIISYYHEYDYNITHYEERLIGPYEEGRWVLLEVGRPCVEMYIGNYPNGKWELVYTDRPYTTVYAGDSNNGEWLVAYTDQPYEIVYIGDEQNGKWEILYTNYEYIIRAIGPDGTTWAATPTAPWYGLSIEKIVLTKSVTDICIGPLEGYGFEVEDGNNSFYSDENGVLFTKDKKTLISYPSKSENTSYSIPDGVTKIEYGAFLNAENLESLVIPDSVKYIESEAFSCCTNLLNIDFQGDFDFLAYDLFTDTAWFEEHPEGVIYAANFALGYSLPEDYYYYEEPIDLVIKEGTTHIAEDAFGGMNIVSVVLPEGLESIGDYAFYCTFLESVAIPDSVKYIGESAFEECYFDYIELPYGVETVGKFAFSVHDYIVLPESVTDVDVGGLECSKLYVKNGSAAEASILENNENDSYWAAIDFGYYYDVILDSGVSGKKVTRAYKLDDRDLYVGVTPGCSGFIVKGWATSADADESECLADNMYTENEDVTLYAVLEKTYEVYTIDRVWLFDYNYSELDSIPDEEFYVSFDCSNYASYDDDYAALASYDCDGRFLGITFAILNSENSWDILVDNTDGKIDTIKIFVFDGLKNMMPYAEVCEID